jgi:hypothetical protein
MADKETETKEEYIKSLTAEIKHHTADLWEAGRCVKEAEKHLLQAKTTEAHIDVNIQEMKRLYFYLTGEEYNEYEW